MHGRTSLSILALLMPAWALFSIGIDDWSHGSRRPIEFENLNAPQVVFFGFCHVGELLLELKSSFNLSTDLAWGDVALDCPTNPQLIRVHLKKSKC